MPKRLSGTRIFGTAAARLLPALLLLSAPTLTAAFLAAPTQAAPAAAPDVAGGPRVSTMYTTWDDYYFYAAFRVRDTDVEGKNSTTTSQPQEDDDLEVFFDTGDDKAKVRTPQTYQMAVSAAQGSYFSVGDGTKIPKGKAVYSYKYAATVNGTLSNPADTDTGYDVEIAIPWSELGQSGPPSPGTTWGFNVISRDRQSDTTPASKFYSLSKNVRSKGDVQNPSKWAQITFVTTDGGRASTTSDVISAKVVGAFPRVNGTIVNGDWPAATQLAFGDRAVDAPAPTVAEEPNTTESPFDNPAGLAPTQTANNVTGLIDLPGGKGSIKIVPGGIKVPAGLEPPVITPPLPPAPPPPKRGKNQRVAQADLGKDVVVNSSTFTLGQTKPPPFVMGIYRLDYNADPRQGPAQAVWSSTGASLLTDQPMNAAGPWFSGLRPSWQRQQLAAMRRAGMDIALLRTQPDDPLLGRELDALVQGLKELKGTGQDYPLIGVDASTGKPDLDMIYAHIPAEFRAVQDIPGTGQPGVLVYDLSLGGADAPKSLADGTPIARVFYNAGIASVTPGRTDRNGVVPRDGGRTYDTSWQVALVQTPDQIVVDSWNDFSHGTEVAASRQYGEQYADTTRANVIGFDGNRPWHAKYLSNTVPRTVFPKTLYQVPVHLENAGTVPWRAGEGYSLSARWYKDGKLFDDSAPRIPVSKDVLPGQTVTLSVGLAARNNFGEDLEPGDYVLVVDMVQGQDRWFSYAGDTPLQIPITVVAATDASSTASARFLGTDTPGGAVPGRDTATLVHLRNDGPAPWTTDYTLGWKVQTMDPDGSNPKTVAEGSQKMGADPVAPGQIADVAVSVPSLDSAGKPLTPGDYRLHWFVRPQGQAAAIDGSYDEPLTVAAALPPVAFTLVDLPRTVDAGKDAQATLSIRNVSPDALPITTTRFGYHWYYLDGTEREWEGGPVTPLLTALPPGADGTVTATFRTPTQPGRYALVWDARSGDGPWQSTLPALAGDSTAMAFISVGGKDFKNGSTVPVDLTKSYNTVGISSTNASRTGGFDGQGATLPVALMPPDGTAEVDVNPFVLGRPGPPLYPSGYYTAQMGTSAESSHALSFLFPATREGQPNVIGCTGQTISLPDGKYKAIHLLMAATSPENQPQPSSFGLVYDKDTLPAPVTVADWGTVPSGASVTPGLTLPYRYTSAGVKAIPVSLGDYALRLDPTRKLTALTLPNSQNIKIVAVTLEK